jgi:hypothetical protein
MIADIITTSTENVFLDVEDARRAAHAKHGERSIETIAPLDPTFLIVLAEEFGEVAHELTYDSLNDVNSGEPLDADALLKRRLERLRAELIDLITVSTAWVSSIDAHTATPIERKS